MKSLTALDYVGRWVKVVNDTDCLYIQNGETYFVEGLRPHPYKQQITHLQLKNKSYGYEPYRFKIIGGYKNLKEWL